jgi:hypothetical protein
LLVAPVVLFDALVFVAAGAVEHPVAQGLADGARVGVMPFGRHLRGGTTDEVQGLREAALGRGHVALLAEQRVDEVAVPIDRAVQIASAPLHPQVRLVRVPLRIVLSAPPGALPRGEQWGAARLPLPDRRVAEHEVPVEEHRRAIPETASGAQPPQHDAPHEVGRVVAVVIWRAGVLLADPAALTAAEEALAARRAARLLDGRGRGAVGTTHEQLLHAAVNAVTLPEYGQSYQPASEF